jgi:TetR/AcrR family transcriptional regulator, fatty acid biosynthesis regulator
MTQRKEAKERTRQRLLEAIVELLDEEGEGALTTVRITQRAGVAQPTFYVHFPDVEQGVAVAAEDMAKRILGVLSTPPEARQALATEWPQRGKGTLKGALRAVLEALLSDRRLARIFLRHRRDVKSPFGLRFGQILGGARELVVEECRKVGAPRPEVMALLVIGLVIASVEGILDGRISGADAALDDLTHAVGGMIRPPAR